MLFFDNQLEDVRCAERVGVVSIMCPIGLYLDDFQRGLDAFKMQMTGDFIPDESALETKAVIADKAVYVGTRPPKIPNRYGKKRKLVALRIRKNWPILNTNI